MNMELLDGTIPEEKTWRTLVLLTLEQEPGLVWQLARSLAHANSGESVAAVILPEASTESALTAARRVLQAAQDATGENETVHTLLVEAVEHRQALISLIEEADIDLLLADAEGPTWRNFERLPCAVAMLRGGTYRTYTEEPGPDAAETETPPAGERADEHDEAPITRILVPTAGGPNSAHALSFLLPLAPAVHITALYVVPSYLGENEQALGKARLRQLANFIDANERIERKVIRANSVTDGIVQEASGDYDLVILGATRESSFDRAVFGDVVGAVVRQSKTPVIVVREADSTIGNVARSLAWRLQNVLPRLSLSQRTDVYVRVRRSARPDTDFFVLIGLSALIAALGLQLNSPAVVIGAMLVAPLMSPMMGAGMAIVLGNTRFLRLSVGAVLKGAALAIVLSILIGFLRPNQPLTTEILSRTQPTLLDLGVALFAGLAGAYALAHSEAAAALPGVAISAALVPPLSAIGIGLATANFPEALGATLLFFANFIAIAAASVLVFVLLGFRPTRSQKARRDAQLRSVRMALILLIVITSLLAFTTYNLAREARLTSRIEEVTKVHVNEKPGMEFASLEIEGIGDSGQPLVLNITARSTGDVPHREVEALRNQIGTDLQPSLEDRELALTLTVIRVTKLDPERPPTATPTATATDTPTPGPTPTATSTATPSPMATTSPSRTTTPAATATPTPSPTFLPTATATPPLATINYIYGLNLRAGPGITAEILAFLPDGASVVLLPGRETVNDIIWQEVAYEDATGWVVAEFLETATAPTATPAATATATATP